jgi:hypothetical protein
MGTNTSDSPSIKFVVFSDSVIAPAEALVAGLVEALLAHCGKSSTTSKQKFVKINSIVS